MSDFLILFRNIRPCECVHAGWCVHRRHYLVHIARDANHDLAERSENHMVFDEIYNISIYISHLVSSKSFVVRSREALRSTHHHCIGMLPLHHPRCTGRYTWTNAEHRCIHLSKYSRRNTALISTCEVERAMTSPNWHVSIHGGGSLLPTSRGCRRGAAAVVTGVARHPIRVLEFGNLFFFFLLTMNGKDRIL